MVGGCAIIFFAVLLTELAPFFFSKSSRGADADVF
jgi:hypothetical protein